MAEPKPRWPSYQDVLDAPDNKVAEIIGGELFVAPRPAGAHAAVSSALGAEITPPFGRGRGGPGGWIILDEPELHFETNVVIPDLAGWRRKQMPKVEDVPYFTLPPDWLCEVLSRSTEKVDRALKLPIYATAGVQHVWLLHPANRTLEVLRIHEGKWLTLAVHRDGQRVRAEPFDAIELDLAVLWADLALPSQALEPTALYEHATP
ncbi:MAG: Uma2 family endonuclease [Myxococcales bacterium]|nr:Uma2 family endonuclease [Myxococcales bacterium]